MMKLKQVVIFETLKRDLENDIWQNIQEAVTPVGMDKLLQKYSQKYANDPKAYNAFLRHALTVLGKSSSLNDADFYAQVNKPPQPGQEPNIAGEKPSTTPGAPGADPKKGPSKLGQMVQKGKDWWKQNRRNKDIKGLKKSLEKIPKTPPGKIFSPQAYPKDMPSLGSLAGQEKSSSPTSKNVQKPFADLPDITPQSKDDPFANEPEFDVPTEPEPLPEPKAPAASKPQPATKKTAGKKAKKPEMPAEKEKEPEKPATKKAAHAPIPKSQQADKPAEKPADKPTEKPAEKPASEKPATKEPDKAPEKEEKPAETPSEKPMSGGDREQRDKDWQKKIAAIKAKRPELAKQIEKSGGAEKPAEKKAEKGMPDLKDLAGQSSAGDFEVADEDLGERIGIGQNPTKIGAQDWNVGEKVKIGFHNDKFTIVGGSAADGWRLVQMGKKYMFFPSKHPRAGRGLYRVGQ